MGTPRQPEPVKLFVAVTFREREPREGWASRLQEAYGFIDIESPVFRFDFTDYYAAEMGSNLLKQFVAFERLIDPADLASVKLQTNRIEEDFRVEGRRTVNLDPGYVDRARVVLATTKDYAHRVYLRSGIYADVHLRFGRNRVDENPWTYPDYKTPEAGDFFVSVRNRYVEQMKGQ